MDELDYLYKSRAQKFTIEISFRGLLGRVVLGVVAVYAETEQEALDLAHNHIQCAAIDGRDQLTIQIHEPVGVYSL